MADRDLIERAEALGVSACYVDWRKQRVDVPVATLRALVDILGPPSAGMTLPAELTPAERMTAGMPDAPAIMLPPVPGRRSWGFTVQLYSVRSRSSWGHGDLHDLADLARWSASQLGAGFVLINPLHAAEPDPPVSSSPYLPMTRRYISPLYLRVEDITEYDLLGPAQRGTIDDLGRPLRAASLTSALINRDLVWTAKRRALELIQLVRRTDPREADYQGFLEREGTELTLWATWCALAERHGPDWRSWPGELADPCRARRLLAADEVLARRADFHCWLQWVASSQLGAAQRAARAAGMDIGVIGDLAVGVHPGGSDAWAHQDMLVQGVSVGAPPDGFSQRGQTWRQPPWHPGRMLESGAKPLADLLAAAFGSVGGLRMDHVMGLTRLWWVPEGMSPDQGAYVRYDHRLTIGALVAQAAAAGALAIGEDLGTIEPWLRSHLASQHVLGTEMLWFASERDGSPLLPAHWRRNCMATVGTHDVATVSGYLTGDQIAVRERLGLLSEPAEDRRVAERKLSGWQAALVAEDLLAPGARPTPAEFTAALYGYLARTPSALVGVSLADAVGDRQTQNIPGTLDQYPNWQVPLCDSDGNAVLIEDLADVDLLRAVVRAASALGPT